MNESPMQSAAATRPNGLARAGLLVMLAFALAGGGFFAGMGFEKYQNGRMSFPVFEEAYTAVESRGYKPLPPRQTIEYGLIRGFLTAYDEPHTVFLEPPQNELANNRLEGRYGGIGAQLQKDQSGEWRLYPISGGPAAKAGLQDGDRLMQVDDLVVAPDLAAELIEAALRGPVDSQVQVSVARDPATAPLAMRLRRSEYALPSLTYRLAPDEARLGVIRINWMSDGTSRELQAAVEALRERGAQAFALDLRQNPGGLLDTGVALARLFLKDGAVMEEQYRDRPIKTYRVESPGPLADVPLAALIDQNTASAAEILAGALKAHQRAPIIGQRSYGKNSIQLVISLSDGSSVHVTAAHWWIPGLEPAIEGRGVQPDYASAPSDPNQPDQALQIAAQVLFP